MERDEQIDCYVIEDKVSHVVHNLYGYLLLWRKWGKF